MIELITGVVGFVAGIGVAVAFFRKRKREHWGKGYIKVRSDMFPKRNEVISQQIPIVGQQTDSQNQENDPKLPNWF